MFVVNYKGVDLAGVDEVGRGPLAGDVVAAAVILDPGKPIVGLRDSKKLSAAKRTELAATQFPAGGLHRHDRDGSVPLHRRGRRSR